MSTDVTVQAEPTDRHCHECNTLMVVVEMKELPAVWICPLCGATLIEVTTPPLVYPGTRGLTPYAKAAIAKVPATTHEELDKLVARITDKEKSQ